MRHVGFYSLSLLLAACLQANAQKISFKEGNISLKQAFQKIEDVSKYKIAYNETQLDMNKTVRLDQTNKDVLDILSEILSGTGYIYSVKDNYIIITSDQQQKKQKTKKITGLVIDENGEPIIGANVIEKGTTNGTVTDIDGRYSLSVPESSVLTVSYIGYADKEVRVGTGTIIDVSLLEDTQALDEVVVVGYGTMKKSDLTGSVVNVNQEQLRNLPTTSIDQKLVGQVAGVQIQQVSGAPGAGTAIKIRGNGSISAGNDPLYVVDGMPYSSGFNQNLNPMSFINPNDIESITVLKDASSTAIYGSRGANGVIMITTKRGNYDQTDVSVSSMVGVQQVPQKGRPKMMNQYQFAELQREKIGMKVRQMEKREPTNADYPAEYLPENLKGEGTDWYDLILQNALIQEHTISVNKGGKESRLNFSMGYYNQEGVLKYTGLERYSGKLTMESNLGKHVKVGASLQPTFIQQKRTNTNANRDDVVGVATWGNPVMSPYDEDGNLIPYIQSPASKYHSAWSFMNPLYVLRETVQKQDNFQNLGIAFIEWEIIQGLKVKSSLNTNFASTKYNQYIPSTVGGSNKPPTAGTGKSTNNRGTSFNWLIENTLTYEKTFAKKHRINAMLGYTAQRSKTDNISLNADPYANDLIQTINAAQAIKSWGQTIDEWSMVSYLGRINYSYEDKYLLTATFRSDGSSRFGDKNRFASFPSVAAAWRVSEEKFLKNNPVIDNLKLRFSYGKSGNNNIGNYAHLASVSADSYIFSDTQVTGSNVGISNPYLTWEESDQIDAGVDVSLFKNRLSFVLDYYYRRSKNMLLKDVIPAITGFTSQMVNKGNIRNTGFEISINATPVASAFTWNVNLNLSLNRNKVISLNDNGDRILAGSNDGNSTHVTVVGKPIGQFFGFVFDGLYTIEDLQNPDVAKNAQAYEGGVRYKDLDNDGVISDMLDYTIIGNPHPDFIYGLTNTFTYKDFDLSIIMNGQCGGKVVNGLRQSIDNLQGFFNVGEEWVNRWRSADNPGDGRHYGVPPLTPSLGHRMSDLWIEDATYLRISNITFGYSLPQQLMRKTGFIKVCRFYLTAQNLATFTKYSGANPEGQSVNQSSVLAPGFDMSSYPLSRTTSIGINLTF
ncbi:MAG: TonB-dependent receptor P26 [Parabacteroides sp.]